MRTDGRTDWQAKNKLPPWLGNTQPCCSVRAVCHDSDCKIHWLRQNPPGNCLSRKVGPPAARSLVLALLWYRRSGNTGCRQQLRYTRRPQGYDPVDDAVRRERNPPPPPHKTKVTAATLQTTFFLTKPTRCTNFTNLFCHETLHVSDSSSVHHQEFIHCTLSSGMCRTGL